jgi:cardiolipin synthase A/B
VTILLAIHLVIVLAFTIRILLRDDLSPSARLAWFIVLMVLPVFGSLAYFLFGEVDLGQRAVKRQRKVFETLHAYVGNQAGSAENVSALIDPQYQAASLYAGSINGFYPVDGNRAELMRDADETARRLIADIDSATDHVNVLYYIWLNDTFGTSVAQALIRAAKRGVTCRAMADGLGSRVMVKSDIWQQMATAGVRLEVALKLKNPLWTIFNSRLDLRNHRKITVIDSKITYCGSQNSADPEFRVKAKYAPWVDIMLRFEGPVVAQNQLLFASDWMFETDECAEQFKLETRHFENGFPAQVFGDGPTIRHGATPQLFTSIFNAARSSITITTPYFVPDTTILEALCAAAYRGVQVVLVFPYNNDSWIVSAASRSYYKKLLMAGVAIYEFKGGLLHSKTLTVDEKFSLIGSSNLDLRSFDLNYENNILLQDRGVTDAIHARQQEYIQSSVRISLGDVKNWPYSKRIWNNVVATVGPIL